MYVAIARKLSASSLSWNVRASSRMTTTRHNRRYCQCHSVSSLSASLSARDVRHLHHPLLRYLGPKKRSTSGFSRLYLRYLFICMVQRHAEPLSRSTYACVIFREQTECVRKGLWRWWRWRQFRTLRARTATLRNEVANGYQKAVSRYHASKFTGPTLADNDTATIRPFTCCAPDSGTPRGSSDRPETRPTSSRSLSCCWSSARPSLPYTCACNVCKRIFSSFFFHACLVCN